MVAGGGGPRRGLGRVNGPWSGGDVSLVRIACGLAQWCDEWDGGPPASGLRDARQGRTIEWLEGGGGVMVVPCRSVAAQCGHDFTR